MRAAVCAAEECRQHLACSVLLCRRQGMWGGGTLCCCAGLRSRLWRPKPPQDTGETFTPIPRVRHNSGDGAMQHWGVVDCTDEWMGQGL